MSYGSELEPATGRRQLSLVAAFIVAAVTVSYLPAGAQEQVASALRATVLRPFIGTQVLLGELHRQGAEADVLRGLVDSLSAELSSQRGLADENRTLRHLLDLGGRMGPSYAAATVLRPGTPGSESMFWIDLGADDGVRVGAPVVTHGGLVGVIRETEPGIAVGMDWTHPDFRASAMIEGGIGFGIVENRRDDALRDFREFDRLVLNGTAFNESFADGSLVTTSGAGGVYPRGIPIGRIAGVESEQGGWLKSYRLEPMVDPAGVTHVLVRVGGDDPEGIRRAWPVDTAWAEGRDSSGDRPR